MNPPPPPPPPHGSGAGAKASGLPPGNYDIFIIPPHSSGSGFLYLPSLQPHRNSFLAGVGCTLFAVAIWSIVAPIFRDWFATIITTGGMGVVMLMVGVGVAGWAWGKTQMETGGPGEGSTGSQQGSGNTTGGTGSQYAGGSGPGGQPPGSMPGGAGGPMPSGAGARAPPKPSWQRANTGPSSGTAGAGNARSGWEKARAETRKKEEERTRSEELRKKREEEEMERIRQRERETQERLAREEELRQWQARAKEAEEKEARLREAEAQEARERKAREKESREKEAQEKEAREREAREREAREKEAREKDAREREAREKRVREYRERIQQRNKEQAATSPTKQHQQPTASTAADEASSYSYRPYDKLKRPVHKANSASSMCSESSYAASQSTSRTTPPPSHRGPYHTKDPDKIVIKAVYSFNNTFPKLPTAQLVSGVGTVTDGLILRITTEGLFIDDDVRGVPQREWDIKAWTLKTSTKLPTSEESDAFLANLLRLCKSKCSGRPNAFLAPEQSGDRMGLHVLRASIRDQEGKRYVFVLQETEGWKVAVGLQRLRRGTQVRALGVGGMAVNETKSVLEGLGWG